MTAPAAPTLTDPHSPANDNNPKVKGTVTTGAPTTIKLYKNPTCAGANPEATETVANFTGPGITITVAEDSTIDLTATALDAASNTSPCSAKLTYIEDSSPPDTVLDGSPNNPTNDSTPTFAFHATGGSSSFECKLDAGPFSSCSSPFTTSSLSAASHTFQVRAVDTATNPDPSPASQTVTVDTGPPATPSIASSAPASPANNNSPKLVGSAEAASTVKLYTSADCTGSVAVDSGPSGPTSDQTPNFGFSSTTAAASFQCRFAAAAFGPCSGPGASHTAASALAEGAHSFAVRALNSLGTADPSPATRAFNIDTTTPDTTITSGPVEGSRSGSPSVSFTYTGLPSAEVDHFECSLDGEGLNDDPDDLGDDDWEGEYAALYTATYSAIQASTAPLCAPSDRVDRRVPCTPDIALAATIHWKDWERGILGRVDHSKIDVVALHPYGTATRKRTISDKVISQVHDARRVVDDHLLDLPKRRRFWVTEVGVQTGLFGSGSYANTRTEQSQQLVAIYNRLRNGPDKVRMVIIHRLIDAAADDPSASARDRTFGVLTENFAKKPAYCGLARARKVAEYPCPG